MLLKWEPEKTAMLLKFWKEFKCPEDVKLIGRYLLIGRHITVTIFEAPDEESILRVTFPIREVGIPQVSPALPLEAALKMIEKM